MKRFFTKLATLRRRRQLDRDLEDELRFHLQMKAEETGDLAGAQRRLGNTTQIAEKCRELWTFSHLEFWWQDIRYALRTLARSPGFTLIAIVALALGIGADTAIFTIIKGAFTWEFGLAHPDRTMIVTAADDAHRNEYEVPYALFNELRTRTKTMAGLAAYQFTSVNLSDDRSFPDRIMCASMSSNGFEVSEQKAALGRTFSPDDEKPGAPAVAVITDALWKDRYAGDPAILGKAIRLNGVARTIAGVIPPKKTRKDSFPEYADVWIPLESRADNRAVLMFGLLAPGVDAAASRAELASIVKGLASSLPFASKGLNVNVQPIAVLYDIYYLRTVLKVLWVAVGFVLLIACADVANMLLARGAGRIREISIRIAIGASRVRIVRQLLIESLMLAICGGALGWMIALAGLRWFEWGADGLSQQWMQLSLDSSAFVYLAAISIATGILFGLAPALRLTKVDVNATIKDGGHGVTNSRSAFSIANALVALQVTLCIILLAGAGLMIRSAFNLYSASIGVDPEDVLAMRLELPEANYKSAEDMVNFHRQLQSRVGATAGVESAAIVSNLPLGGWIGSPYQIEGENIEPDHLPRVGAIIASPDYFNVLRIHPRQGRTLNDSDGVSGVPVVLVNESFATKFWPSETPLGKRVRLFQEKTPQPWLTVVGVIPDVLQSVRHPVERVPLIYLPYSEQPLRGMSLVVKTRISAASLAPGIRRAVQSVDQDLATSGGITLEHKLAQDRLSTKLLGSMFTIFAGVALLLATVGLYAVVANSIGRRTQEIGLRMAIGGTPRDVLRLVMRQGLQPILVGMLLGLPLAFIVTRVLSSELIGVSAGDPLVFAAILIVLALAGVLGCAIPARRAMRVDPIVALRYE